MVTIVRSKTLIGLYIEQARLQTLVSQLELRLADKQRDLDGAGEECAELKEDLRKVFGLKPRIAPPAPVDAPLASSGSGSQQFKINETPRDLLARMQREHNVQAEREDQDAVRQAIADFEEVLKNK